MSSTATIASSSDSGPSSATHQSALSWAALPVEALGGIFYHAALAFEGGRSRLVRRIWEIQIAAVLVLGAWLAFTHRATGTALCIGLDLTWWLLLAAAFVPGMYGFEGYVRCWFARAGLRFEDD